MNDKLNQYIEDIRADLNFDIINVTEAARKLPARRHYWSARLVEHKIRVHTLKRNKSEIIKAVSARVAASSPVGMDGKNITRAAESSDEIQHINSEIAECEIIIEFLESVAKNFFTATYDIKNIIELMKLEQS